MREEEDRERKRERASERERERSEGKKRREECVPTLPLPLSPPLSFPRVTFRPVITRTAHKENVADSANFLAGGSRRRFNAMTQSRARARTVSPSLSLLLAPPSSPRVATQRSRSGGLYTCIRRPERFSRGAPYGGGTVREDRPRARPPPRRAADFPFLYL